MENKTGKFLAGYGEADITPDYSVPLAGFGNSHLRMSDTVLSRFKCQCTAMMDTEGNTLLMFTYDLVRVRTIFFEQLVAYFEEKHGIPEAYIHLTASHSESSPDTWATEKCPQMLEYNKMVVEKLIECGEAALADLSPATLAYGSTHCRNLNFVKHAFFDTGVSLGDNKGRASDGNVVQHTTKVDDLLLAIRIEREEKKPILFVNWRAHNQFTCGSTKKYLCADYVGALRDCAMEKFGAHLQFFMGAAGNVNPYSYIRSEERTRDYIQYAQFLTEYLYDILHNLTPIAAGRIKANKVMVTGKINHDEDCRIEDAERVWELNAKAKDFAEPAALAKSLGFNSTYHALGVCRRYNAPATRDYAISVWAIGDLGFNCTQFETFDTLGKFIRENSPYPFQFVLGYSDDESAYMPSAYSYEYGCYEADNSMFAIGTGEQMAAKSVQMLIDLKYQR